MGKIDFFEIIRIRVRPKPRKKAKQKQLKKALS